MDVTTFNKRFEALQKEISDLMLNKNHDYAGTEDPLKNLKECEKAGIPAWVGIAGVRLGDKMSRIQNFCKQRELKVKDESLKDTLRDMAVYSLLCIIAFEESQETKTEAQKTLIQG